MQKNKKGNKKKIVVGNIEYICPKCGYIKQHDNVLLAAAKRLIVSLGIVFFIFMVVVILTTPNTLYVFLYRNAYNIDSNMRDLGLTMARNCTGDSECVAKLVYNNLSQELTYSLTPYGKLTSPKDTWHYRSGDCKSMSELYTNILTNMGVDSMVSGSSYFEHAVSFVYFKDTDYYWVVDLTVPKIEQWGVGVDYWKFHEAQAKYGKPVITTNNQTENKNISEVDRK
jgi:hypothetical protein